jgi:hypothetical protein
VTFITVKQNVEHVPAAKAVICLLKFKYRMAGNCPSFEDEPSWGLCKSTRPPVVPQTREGLIPSTDKRYDSYIINIREKEERWRI